MQLKEPITRNGIEYPYATITLIASDVEVDGQINTSLVVTVSPFNDTEKLGRSFKITKGSIQQEGTLKQKLALMQVIELLKEVIDEDLTNKNLKNG